MKLFSAIAILFFCLLPVVNGDETRNSTPNVVWIFAEDMNAWMGCYGDSTVPTPNINGLASRGLRFDRAYMPAGVCSATRSALAVGAMQTSMGIHNHRSSRKRVPEEVIYLPEGVKTVYEVMRDNGYYVTTQGMNKNDFNFVWQSDSLYDKVGKAFDQPIWRGRAEGQPFFAQIQLKGGKNTGQFMGAPSKENKNQVHTAASKMEVPPYYPDHRVYRREMAHHYDTIRQTDDEVGKILAALKADGLLEKTVVFFFTDHGMRLPRHKQWLYEGGIRVPLIVAGPGIDQNEVNNELISGIDISVTTLGLAGISKPTWMEGQDFFAADYRPREFVVSARDRCDYTIERVRAITTRRYKYIRNFLTDRPFMQPQYRDNRPEMKIGKQLYADGKLNEVQALIWQDERVAEELYDLDNDPHEVKNLVNDPQHAEALQRHRQLLADWIKTTDDKGQYKESVDSLRGVLKRWSKQAVNPEYEAARNRDQR